MKDNFSKLIISGLFIMTLAACSATADKERQVEAIAAHRASILSNNLPIEHGPLTVMQAKANGRIVELMMIYNSEGSIPPQQLIEKSVSYYCSNSEVKANLVHGVIYNIKIRSERGQLLIEQIVSIDTCTALSEETKG